MTFQREQPGRSAQRICTFCVQHNCANISLVGWSVKAVGRVHEWSVDVCLYKERRDDVVSATCGKVTIASRPGRANKRVCSTLNQVGLTCP